jgi:hypothetical protein
MGFLKERLGWMGRDSSLREFVSGTQRLNCARVVGQLLTFFAGDILGPYEIRAPIGAGWVGQVYRPYDQRLKRDMTITISTRRVRAA